MTTYCDLMTAIKTCVMQK